MRSIIKYFQQILLFLPLCFLLFQVSAINHQVLSADPTCREFRRICTPEQVRSIIKYFQQIRPPEKSEKAQKAIRGAINHQVLSANPTNCWFERLVMSHWCDQSSSTFSRSYTANGLYLNKEEKVRSIIKYFQQVLPLAGTRLL